METILWLTYGWRFLNWLDMLASAARQFVCRYLSYVRRRFKCILLLTRDALRSEIFSTHPHLEHVVLYRPDDDENK